MYESCPGLGSRKMFRQEVIHGWSMTPDYTTWEDYAIINTKNNSI